MKIDIENIITFKKRNKVYTTQWRKIFEVKNKIISKKLIFFQMI